MPTRLLILLALGSPLASALLLRYLRTRLTAVPFYSIGALLFGVAGAAVLLLAQANVERVQIGQLILVQPQGVDLAHDDEDGDDHADEQPTPTPTLIQVGGTPTASPAAAASPTSAATPTATARATATASPTATATSAPPTASPTPTSAPPTATAAPTVRRYTVQNGDTLRSIAEDFGVTVQQIINANNFSADDADSIQPGDTLIIP